MSAVRSVEELEAIYDTPVRGAIIKETAHITPHHRAYIEASPFALLATAGPEGLDCSPRGDKPGFVRVVDERTLMMPDRRGNNRLDSLKNIVRDPRIALLFLVPGSGNTLRVNGRAVIDTDDERRQSFAVEGQAPRSVIVMKVEAVYVQCARAIVRSDLWNPERHIAAGTLPTPGQIVEALSHDPFDGAAYDRDWPARARKTLW